MLPNRMQNYWETVRPFLKKGWPRLTDVDLDEVNGQYDRLIHKIKEVYRGGEEIMQEAGVKGKIQKFLSDLEERLAEKSS